MIHRILPFFIVTAALAGCEPHYQALTAPPPFTKAELCDGQELCGGNETITVTKGIALAFECKGPEGGRCENAKATLKDPSIATVFDAHLDTLSASIGYPATVTPRTAFVIVGKSVGKTTLTVASVAGSTDFAVTVESF